MNEFLAHISEDGSRVQTVTEHCLRTAEYAASTVELVGLSESAYLAGILHDAGKFTNAFTTYLRKALSGENARRGSVNHTFCGCRLLLEQFHQDDPVRFDGLVSELLAFAVGSHHGLFDCLDEERRNGFDHRLEKDGICYEEAVENYRLYCMDDKEFSDRFQKAISELGVVLERIGAMTGDEVDDSTYEQETSFYIGFLGRLLLSAVIEGDRRDTAEFMCGTAFPEKCTAGEKKLMWSSCLDRIEKKLDTLPRQTEIDRVRRHISDRCRSAAAKPGGVYRMHVPTGGGRYTRPRWGSPGSATWWNFTALRNTVGKACL